MRDRVTWRRAALLGALALLATACSATAPSTPTPSPGTPTPSPGVTTPSVVASPSPDGTTTTSGTAGCLSGRPLVDEARWIEVEGQATVAVVPSELLRGCGLAGVDDRAWTEVLRLQPDADTPGMAEQFTCHVLFAPGKDAWHLEPWRPVVDDTEMIAARCNPR